MYKLKNENGVTKEVKNGISWTVFFFGILVPLFRADWKWFLIALVAVPATFGVFWLFMVFKYNKWYLDDLLNKGYEIQV